jgi:phage antirepressor YoqD-like protein
MAEYRFRHNKSPATKRQRAPKIQSNYPVAQAYDSSTGASTSIVAGTMLPSSFSRALFHRAALIIDPFHYTTATGGGRKACPNKPKSKEVPVMNTKAKLPIVSHRFTYQDKPLRMLQDTCETWFVAADICTALGLPQVSRAVRRIDPAYTKLMKVSLLQQPRRYVEMNVVNPAGLNQLILLADKQPARSLRRWLRREVAPVQQWCADDPYAAAFGRPEPQAPATVATVTTPATGEAGLPLPPFSRRDLLRLAVEAEGECDQLRRQNAELADKADAYDRLTDTTDTFSLGETAKMLGIPLQGRNNLIKFLRTDGVLMQGNVPLQRYIDSGYFSVVQQDYFAPDGTPHVRPVARVHASGVEFIRSRMENFILRQLTKSGKK